jgi:hypothetical protein
MMDISLLRQGVSGLAADSGWAANVNWPLAAKAGFVLLLQTTVLLVLGLVVMSWLRRRSLALQSVVGRSLLAGVVLASVISLTLAGRVRPLWGIAAPVTPHVQGAIPNFTSGESPLSANEYSKEQRLDTMPSRSCDPGRPLRSQPVLWCHRFKPKWSRRNPTTGFTRAL